MGHSPEVKMPEEDLNHRGKKVYGELMTPELDRFLGAPNVLKA